MQFYKRRLEESMTISSALLKQRALDALQRAGVSDAAASVRWLAAHFLRKPGPSQDDIQRFQAAIERRKLHEPVQYIISEWDFGELRRIKCAAPVLIPREETYGLVKCVSKHITEMQSWKSDLHTSSDTSEIRFLEIGSGTGAISVSLLHAHKHVTGVAIDINERAVSLTRENAARFGVADRLKVLQSDFNDVEIDPTQRMDILVSNPPYVTPREYDTELERDVKDYEDKVALVGGEPFGLGVTLKLLEHTVAKRWLKHNAHVFLELHRLHPSLFAVLYDIPLPISCRSEFAMQHTHCPPSLDDLLERTQLTRQDIAAIKTSTYAWRKHLSIHSFHADMFGHPRFVQFQYKETLA